MLHVSGLLPLKAVAGARSCTIIRLPITGKPAAPCGKDFTHRAADKNACSRCDKHGANNFTKSQSIDFSGEVATPDAFMKFRTAHPHVYLWCVDRPDGVSWQDILGEPAEFRCFHGDECPAADWPEANQPQKSGCITCNTTYCETYQGLSPEDPTTTITSSCWDPLTTLESPVVPNCHTCPVCTAMDKGHRYAPWAFPQSAHMQRHTAKQLEAAQTQSAAIDKAIAGKKKITKVKPPIACDSRGAWFIRDTGAMGGEANASKWMFLAKQTPFDADPQQKIRFQAAIKSKEEQFDEIPVEAGRFWDCMHSSVESFERLEKREDLIGGTDYISDNRYFLQIGLKWSRWIAQKKTLKLAILFLEHWRGYCRRDTGVTRMVLDEDETKPYPEALKDAQAQLDEEDRDQKLAEHVSTMEATLKKRLDTIQDQLRRATQKGPGGAGGGGAQKGGGPNNNNNNNNANPKAKTPRKRCDICNKYGHTAEEHDDRHERQDDTMKRKVSFRADSDDSSDVDGSTKIDNIIVKTTSAGGAGSKSPQKKKRKSKGSTG